MGHKEGEMGDRGDVYRYREAVRVRSGVPVCKD